MGKKIKNLNHFVYIPKISQSYNYFFYIRVFRQKIFKSQKNYTNRLQEGLKFHIISTAFTNFNTTNSHHLIREHFKSYLLFNHRQSLGIKSHRNQWQGSGIHSTIFNSFINIFSIFNIKPLLIKAFAVGHLI